MSLSFAFFLSGCSDSPEDAPAVMGEGAQPAAVTRVGLEDVPPSAWDLNPEVRWSLEPELRLGSVDGGGPEVFGLIRSVIPDGTGGVWIFDQQAFELRHFGAEGQHLRTVGQQGQGPGEFSGNSCARPGANGEIWVESELNWHRFDSSGEFLRTFRMPGATTCATRAWLPDGRYVAAQVDFDRSIDELSSFFVIYDWNGESLTPSDTVQPPALPDPPTVTFVNASGTGRSVRRVPFVHAADWRLSADGRIWVWEGDGEYELRLQSLAGDTIRRISRTYAPVSIDGDVRQEAISALERPGWTAETDFSSSQVPQMYPPFSSVMSAPDESVWVSREVGADMEQWDIFGPSGDYLGILDVPESLSGIRIMHIGPDHMWGIVRDDLDVQFVVRARIEGPGV